MIRASLLAGIVALLAAGCGGGRRAVPHGVAAARTTVHRCTPATRRVGTPTAAQGAEVARPTIAYRTPGHGPIERFGRRNENGAPTVFGVLGERVDARCRATWLHVELPIRPNGATGWVRAADVVRWWVHTRITVDLSQKRVQLYRNGRLLLSSPAAVGSSATPTPLGRYYVDQRLLLDDAGGPYGPGAVGISAFSPVLTGWAQGGPVAIHGTNEPWSIGRAVSNGCIRLPNATLRKLFPQVPAGTPVVIRR